MNTITMAFLGKGGVGKTVLAALTGKVFSSAGLKILLVDADPARGLTSSLGITSIKTIGQARDEIIAAAKGAGSDEEKEELSEIIDCLLMEALYESPEFSLISMGNTSTLGCYCPLNNLLRGTIKSIGANYDMIIIDAEAGIEQVNRQVVETVDYPVIVTDNSMRGVSTALMIQELIGRVPGMKPAETGVIFNRVEKENDDLVNKVKQAGLHYYGSIPPDPMISSLDMKGDSLFLIGASASSIAGLKKIFLKIHILSSYIK
jgi:CO dehydrogenase maturation factor